LTYRDHIEQLATELGVGLNFNSWQAQSINSPAFGDVGNGPEVHLVGADITTLSEYTTTLHELGHCATLPRPFPRPYNCSPDFVLEHEIKAWEWAREHAELGFAPVEAVWGLMSYMLGRCLHADHATGLAFIDSLEVDSSALENRLMAELGEQLALAA
jgi:hypothetical protein